jgi:FAD/FMN-containing dehydrogenase
MTAQIVEQYHHVRERIAQAARRAGREPADITLIAVTKTWPVEVLLAAYEAGMRDFGENRVEKLAEKRAVMDQPITWHQIGPLQSRKTDLAADFADVFHFTDILLELGGRVYLAKDSCILARQFERMYDRLPEWREIVRQYDPKNRVQSDLSRRLNMKPW